MAKTISSAVDLMAVLAGKTELFETDGLTVELRSLTFAEVNDLANYKGDNAEMAYQAFVRGLVSPALEAEQLDALRKGLPGPLLKISKRVLTLSGLEGDKEDASPLAGGASSS
jgi:hypothetical protein